MSRFCGLLRIRCAGSNVGKMTDLDELRAFLLEGGLDVEVEERMVSLTASAEGGAAYAYFILTPIVSGFFGGLGGELFKTSWARLAELARRQPIIVQDERLSVHIDSRTPRAAIEELAAGRFPDDVEEIWWDESTSSWVSD
jgi:hypothetical protein